MQASPSFYTLLNRSITDNNTLLCVGLDPVPKLIPQHLGTGLNALYTFCKAIVDATASLVCAFKPQIAHFSALGAEQQLVQLIQYIHEAYPGLPVILDAKRGDIGSTAELYAKEAFVRYCADAVTVNPYLGKESIQPFLDYPGRGTIVLCRTSNPDSAWLQKFPDDDPAFLKVAKAAVTWQKTSEVMLVAGATYPEEIAAIRDIATHVPLLVPGIGAQGGDLQKVLKAGLIDGTGMVINASRSIIYASADTDFAQAAGLAAIGLRDEINRYR